MGYTPQAAPYLLLPFWGILDLRAVGDCIAHQALWMTGGRRSRERSSWNVSTTAHCGLSPPVRAALLPQGMMHTSVHA